MENHTESIDFIKFNFDGKLCVTGGLNNALRIWENCQNGEQKLKCTVNEGPDSKDDMCFV